MESVRGIIRVAHILRDRNNWKRFLAWKDQQGQAVRSAVRYHVNRALACRTPALGIHVYTCEACGTARLIPHSCKSRFCSSCGTARTESWCRQLLSELLDVPYRHLIFTIPWQLRLIIQDNRARLEQVLFRAAADSILALTRGTPRPLGRKAQERMARKRKKYLPGIQEALHSFGNDIKWNPHIHMMVTAGGLSLDGEEWIDAPDRSLVSAVELATEWKLRVIELIAREHKKERLVCRRLRCDRRRRLKVGELLGNIRRRRWRVLIGPSLEDPRHAVLYCARYSRRAALGETRITKYDGQYVTFRYKDYYNQGKPAWKKLPVLVFIDRLTQHIPEKGARHFRSYGLFAPRVKTELLAKARAIIGQRKRPRPADLTWEQRRKQSGEKTPLACPRCGGHMRYAYDLFGNHAVLAFLAGCSAEERIPPQTYISASRLRAICA